MTFLPIVDRELRVAARRRGTYLTRTSVALAAFVIGSVLHTAYVFVPAQQVGQSIFVGLAGLCLLYGLGAGRQLTADCLSEEKREGTLGLLFLTDLKGHDIVLGKLAATSLNGFYALLAVLPVLAIPLLMGGVSNEEFWRMALVLAVTFLFSLAVGIFASALSRDARRAVGNNFLLLLLIIAVLPACAGVQVMSSSSPASRFTPELLYSCPVYAAVRSLDANYASAAHHFWGSVGVIHALTWLLVGLASWVVPYSWRDKPALPRRERGRWRQWWRALSYGRSAQLPAFRRELLNVNAFYWLASRARLKPVHVWLFLPGASVWWVMGWLANGQFWLDEAVSLAGIFIVNTALKLWVAIEAGQQLAEDRKVGALELLFSTRMSERDIVDGQFLALRRQFLRPMIVVTVLELLLMVLAWHKSNGWQAPALCLASLLMLWADVLALAWVAMYAALTAKSPQHASMATVGRVLFLPWFIFGIFAGVSNAWSALTSPNAETLGWEVNLSVWLALGIATDLLFGFLSRARLLSQFRELALQRYSSVTTPPLVVRGLARLGAWSAWLRAKRSGGGTSLTRQVASLLRSRKAVLVGAVGIVAISLVLVSFRSQTDFPPPRVVTLSQSNAPLRVFPGVTGLLLILPDGSLWRWGQPGGLMMPQTIVPEQIGTNLDWVDASFNFDRCLGIRRDGTLWEWGRRMDNTISQDPVQVGSESNWARAAAGNGHALALQKDGTLWGWGNNSQNQLGNGAGKNQRVMVRVGTSGNWADVWGEGAGSYGICTNGTLWTWGQYYFYSPATASFTVANFPTPTLICQETNWSRFAGGPWLQVWTQSGELWGGLSGAPNAQAPITGIAQKLLTGSAPGRGAFGVSFSDAPKVYEVRANGTLWERTCAYGPWINAPQAGWLQVGKRADWLGVWGSGTVVGLTSDGTVWTWGLDPSRVQKSGFSSQLQIVKTRIQSLFGRRPWMSVSGIQPAYQKEPRPLLKMISASGNSTAVTNLPAIDPQR